MSTVVARILAADSDAAVRDFLTLSLVGAGFEVETVASAGEALHAINKRLPEAILISSILADMPGLDLVRRIREDQRTGFLPIIMLALRDEELDAYDSISRDIDDYVTKPISARELVTRLRSLLRRTAPQHGRDVVAFAGVVLDASEITVSVDGTECCLRPIEFKLLRMLLSQPRRVFTRSQLIDLVWNNQQPVDARSVDVAMRRLRQAIGPRGYDLLETVRGVGYRVSDKQAQQTEQG